MAVSWGASKEAWHHYSAELGLTAHLLPVVSNPRAEISGGSTMKGLGKTPSLYNRERKVAGIPKWTELQATPADVARWSMEPDYGICIQTRAIRAIDIDVPDRDKANRIAAAISYSLPKRFRADSGKCLMAFKFDGAWPKRVIPVDGGIIEFLGDGQQFIAEGTHPEGERYKWAGSLVGTPELTEAELEALWLDLVVEFGIGEPRIARQKRVGIRLDDLDVHDPVVDWLVEKWETYDVGSDGQVFIDCPFADEHSVDSGPTATAYFPAGTGGYQQGHFVCLHAHCAGRADVDYLDATGFNVGQFDDLGPALVRAAEERDVHAEDGAAAGTELLVEDGEVRRAAAAEAAGLEPWPTLVRDKAGKIEATADNLTKCISRPDIIFRHLAYDQFKDELVWAPGEQRLNEAQWEAFGDADVVRIRIELERRGFKPLGKELLRDALHMVAVDHRIDTAQTWLDRTVWDGVPRVERFAAECWGWADTAYSAAVSRYVWTALAGRVLQPGVRCDMAPILVGGQGLKKTTALQMMAPSEDFYAEIKLDDRNDDNVSRKMRGKLVGELEELRGLNTRAIEEIKAFVTRRKEEWIPKFKEYRTDFWRRLILFGTTNEDEILSDTTGERRWLPGRCLGPLDIDKIIAWRDQLWAEGAFRFEIGGVDWRDAEQLAELEHASYKVRDVWVAPVLRWLLEPQIGDVKPLDKGYIELGEALAGAVGVPIAQQDQVRKTRMAKVLRAVGLSKAMVDDDWVYVRSEP